jgi:Cu2+-exporting ATPase
MDASLGLQDYYRLRDTPASRAVSVGDYSAWDRPQLQRLYVHRRANGDAEVCVLLEGLRCAACSWLIERALSAMEGVRETCVSVPGKRVSIVWQPDVAPLGAVLAAIAHLGYVPHPLDRQSLSDVAEREQRAAMKRLVVAGLGMMQAMMFAIVLYAGALEGIDTSTRDFFRWIGLLVTIPVVFTGAPVLHRRLARLRARRPGMDTPVRSGGPGIRRQRRRDRARRRACLLRFSQHVRVPAAGRTLPRNARAPPRQRYRRRIGQAAACGRAAARCERGCREYRRA